MKKIGVLTSGGDAPGMNAAIRAVTRAGLDMGMEVVGVMRGYSGLLNSEFVKMDSRSVSGIIQRGGTMLLSARCPEFQTEEGQMQGVENLKKEGIEGLVTIGGDGTFHGAEVLSVKYGIPTIGIPGTIDNDLAYTDFTLGFDTACNTALSLINNLRDTMRSHERVSVVEVMGRRCGDIALYSGIASGAEVIMIPEDPMSIEEVCERLDKAKERGKSSSIIILAEGAGTADDVAKQVSEKTGMSVRGTVLGHLLRGGSPTLNDRLLATQCGYRAAVLLKNGIGNRVIGTRNEQIIDLDIVEALSMERRFHKELYEASKILSF